MYDLFNDILAPVGATYQSPDFNYIRRSYRSEVDKIVEYYQTRTFTVASNHLLCRLIQTGSISLEHDWLNFSDITSIRSPYLARHFKFTSPEIPGQMFKGVFYGERINEFIISVEDSFDRNNAIMHWKHIEAVQVLYHPVSNLGLMIPDGELNNSEEGIAVIAINIPLLLLQYRCYCLERINQIGEAGSINIARFVKTYVLPNMLYSHTDLVLLNRLVNLFYGAPMGACLKRYVFPIYDYSQRTDRALLNTIEYLKDRPSSYINYLESIPAITHNTVRRCLKMPDVAPTRQVWWLLFMTRFYYSLFLIDLGGIRGKAANHTLINQLKVDIKRLLNESSFEAYLPSELLHEIIPLMEDFITT